ncbi:MAG: hypothetical protein P4L43_15315 [Syntrophobacteraceae bacterium]|nr:hypothetical protein [Syntrophobacteraceae bacterium]
MAQREAPRLEEWALDDSSALELEIEKEIDALFVPAVRNPAPNAVAAAGSPAQPLDLDAVTIPAATEGLMANNDAPRHKASTIDDSTALELEIEKEIDALFVPAVRKPDPDATAAAQPPNQKKDGLSDAMQPPGDLNAIQIEIDKEIDKVFVPSPPADSFSGEPTDPSGGLLRLIEQFNAAYLSLDWDFSRENLQKTVDALEQLEPMALKYTETKSVYRIMEVILKRLLEKPRAVNTQLVQVIRDSQGLLAHLLLIEGESGPHEKQRLKELVEKFQDLRQKAIAAKAAGPRPDLSNTSQRSSDNSSTITPSEPPAGVLATSLYGATQSGAGNTTPLAAETQGVSPAPAATICEPRPETEAPMRSVLHTDVCLLVSEAKAIALPESCVVKVSRCTVRIWAKILKRGFATLSDFRPLFRSAKSGVFDNWAKLPPKELRSYKFEPLGFDFCGPAIATGPIAVLASDGQTHRIIFCDTVNYISNAQIACEFPANVGLFSTVELRVKVPFTDVHCPGSALPCDA